MLVSQGLVIGDDISAQWIPAQARALQPDARTLKALRGLGKINATHVEAAAALDVSRETLERFLGKHKKAEEAFESGKSDGRISLRRAQFKAALGGNPTMLVWMGKQLLGQRDKIEHGGDQEGAPIRHTVDFTKMTPKEAAEAYEAMIRDIR